jgi:PAS domain S-box-containing protein
MVYRCRRYCDFVNQRWLEYAGLSLGQVQGWGWEAVIHPDDLSQLMAHWQSCLASGTPVNKEARMRRFDGVYRWFLFLGNPLRADSGNIVKWFGTNVDVEDRKRAEDALRASERNLVQIINTIPTTAWSTRPDGYCDFLSDRWLDYAGFTMEQAVGWNWGTVIHPDDSPGLVDYWQACLASGTPVDTEARMRRFDGVYRWFLFRANPFRDGSGDIVKWYGANVDIEDRKQADGALRTSERSLSLIINTIPMFAWSTRPDGYCDFLNQRWLDYAGMTAEQARGWAWGAAIHPDDAPGLVEVRETFQSLPRFARRAHARQAAHHRTPPAELPRNSRLIHAGREDPDAGHAGTRRPIRAHAGRIRWAAPALQTTMPSVRGARRAHPVGAPSAAPSTTD